MKFFTATSDKINQGFENIQEQLDRLQPRDRLAIVFLSIFLTVMIIGCALWFTHKGAMGQQQRLIDLKETIHWMQSNAVQLSTQSAEALSSAEKIQRVAQQQGLSVQSQESQGQIRLITTHQNYAVLANFLTQLAQQGVTIISLDMQKQEGGDIRLNATLQ